MLGGLVILGLRVLTVWNNWDLPYEYAVMFVGFAIWCSGAACVAMGLRRFRRLVMLDKRVAPATRVQAMVLTGVFVGYLVVLGFYSWSSSKTPVPKPTRAPGELIMLLHLVMLSGFLLFQLISTTRQPPPVDDSPEQA
jgi:hypothetical protein